MKRFTTVALAIFAMTYTAFAQSVLRVAADSSSGTYAKMLGELVSSCSDNSLDIEAVVGNPAGSNGGAIGNLDALYNNKADAAFMHSDVYLYNAQSDPSYNKFKTLIAFWPESIHVVVLTQSKTKKQGALSFGYQTFNTLSDLHGFSVAAAGGGVLTSRILSSQGGGEFTVVDAGSGREVMSKLDSGEVAAAIFVGAAPLPNLEAVQHGGKYRVIPVGESIASRVGNIYRSSKINYPGLTNGPITTLAPLATLVSKSFNTPAKTLAQRKLRTCIAAKLGELQDSGSANWQDVTVGDHGIASIPWLDLPTTTYGEPGTKGRNK